MGCSSSKPTASPAELDNLKIELESIKLKSIEQQNLLRFKVEVMVNMLAIEEKRTETTTKRLEALKWVLHSQGVSEETMKSLLISAENDEDPTEALGETRRSRGAFPIDLSGAISRMTDEFAKFPDEIIECFADEEGKIVAMLSADEFKRQLYAVTEDVTKADVQILSIRFDDGSGSVSIPEFIEFFTTPDHVRAAKAATAAVRMSLSLLQLEAAVAAEEDPLAYLDDEDLLLIGDEEGRQQQGEREKGGDGMGGFTESLEGTHRTDALDKAVKRLLVMWPFVWKELEQQLRVEAALAADEEEPGGAAAGAAAMGALSIADPTVSLSSSGIVPGPDTKIMAFDLFVETLLKVCGEESNILLAEAAAGRISFGPETQPPAEPEPVKNAKNKETNVAAKGKKDDGKQTSKNEKGAVPPEKKKTGSMFSRKKSPPSVEDPDQAREDGEREGEEENVAVGKKGANSKKSKDGEKSLRFSKDTKSKKTASQRKGMDQGKKGLNARRKSTGSDASERDELDSDEEEGKEEEEEEEEEDEEIKPELRAMFGKAAKGKGKSDQDKKGAKIAEKQLKGKGIGKRNGESAEEDESDRTTDADASADEVKGSIGKSAKGKAKNGKADLEEDGEDEGGEKREPLRVRPILPEDADFLAERFELTGLVHYGHFLQYFRETYSALVRNKQALKMSVTTAGAGDGSFPSPLRSFSTRGGSVECLRASATSPLLLTADGSRANGGVGGMGTLRTAGLGVSPFRMSSEWKTLRANSVLQTRETMSHNQLNKPLTRAARAESVANVSSSISGRLPLSRTASRSASAAAAEGRVFKGPKQLLLPSPGAASDVKTAEADGKRRSSKADEPQLQEDDDPLFNQIMSKKEKEGRKARKAGDTDGVGSAKNEKSMKEKNVGDDDDEEDVDRDVESEDREEKEGEKGEGKGEGKEEEKKEDLEPVKGVEVVESAGCCGGSKKPKKDKDKSAVEAAAAAKEAAAKKSVKGKEIGKGKGKDDSSEEKDDDNTSKKSNNSLEDGVDKDGDGKAESKSEKRGGDKKEKKEDKHADSPVKPARKGGSAGKLSLETSNYSETEGGRKNDKLRANLDKNFATPKHMGKNKKRFVDGIEDDSGSGSADPLTSRARAASGGGPSRRRRALDSEEDEERGKTLPNRAGLGLANGANRSKGRFRRRADIDQLIDKVEDED